MSAHPPWPTSRDSAPPASRTLRAARHSGGPSGSAPQMTDRWGIDLEFTRPGEIEQENSFSYLAGGLETVLPDFAPGRFPPAVGMPIDIGRIGTALSVPFSSMTKQRYSTLTVMPYVRQSLGSRADILLSGGLAFVRNSSRREFWRRHQASSAASPHSSSHS